MTTTTINNNNNNSFIIIITLKIPSCPNCCGLLGFFSTVVKWWEIQTKKYYKIKKTASDITRGKCKCLSVQVSERASVWACKCLSVQVSERASVWACKCLSVQVCSQTLLISSPRNVPINRTTCSSSWTLNFQISFRYLTTMPPHHLQKHTNEEID